MVGVVVGVPVLHACSAGCNLVVVVVVVAVFATFGVLSGDYDFWLAGDGKSETFLQKIFIL